MEVLPRGGNEKVTWIMGVIMKVVFSMKSDHLLILCF